MDNPEYTFQILEVFSKIKTKEIPRELEEYISYVARTGDPVFQWSLVKVLLKEKLLAVLDDFLENGSYADIPPCPNVDVFNYESMKTNLLTRLDSFVLPPFTIQRICELLATPRKEYNRIDKYMRAVEKNVLVVSASDRSLKRGIETDGNDSVINGILYDKVNDSLNSFTNHIFSEEQEDELNVSSKMDETDAVQQIIDESWSEENNDEFKLNDMNDSTINIKQKEDELDISNKLDETDAVQQIIDESWNEENSDEFKLTDTSNSSLNLSGETGDGFKLNDTNNSSLDKEEELDMSTKLGETEAVQQMIDESWSEENNEEFKLNDPNDSALSCSQIKQKEEELNLSGKLEGTDTVQQIMHESWSEENNDEFKINDTNDALVNVNSSISTHQEEGEPNASRKSNETDPIQRMDETETIQQMEETDVVQAVAVPHITDGPWSEGNDEFKLNDANNSSLNVSFENELQLVSDESADEKNTNCESKDSDSSFDKCSFVNTDKVITTSEIN